MRHSVLKSHNILSCLWSINRISNTFLAVENNISQKSKFIRILGQVLLKPDTQFLSTAVLLTKLNQN